MGWAIIECPCCGARMELGKHISMKTRADGIRSMSDEELAENLMKAYDCPKGKDCVEQMPGEDGFHQCKRCWVEWLRQECAE